MHFAVGMAGGAVIAAGAALVLRRGWRYTPLAMTLGGVWAIIPDTPRLVRIDFPSLRGVPGLTAFGDKATEAWLHGIGDVFFFHRTLDRNAPDLALAGVFGMASLYTVGLVVLLGVIGWQAARIRLLRARLRSHATLGGPGFVERRRADPEEPRGGRPGEPMPRRRRTDWQRSA